jgi:hypothetical protein
MGVKGAVLEGMVLPDRWQGTSLIMHWSQWAIVLSWSR